MARPRPRPGAGGLNYLDLAPPRNNVSDFVAISKNRNETNKLEFDQKVTEIKLHRETEKHQLNQSVIRANLRTEADKTKFEQSVIKTKLITEAEKRREETEKRKFNEFVAVSENQRKIDDQQFTKFRELSKDDRETSKLSIDSFVATSREIRENEKRTAEDDLNHVTMLERMSAMRINEEKAERENNFPDYTRGLEALNYHQHRADFEKSKYQLDAVINQNFTESNRKAYFEFDKIEHGTRFTASNLKCDPEIKINFMALWNSTFSSLRDTWEYTIPKLLELSTKTVANNAAFKQYIDKIKLVIEDRSRIALETGRGNLFVFQTGPKFEYTFRSIPSDMMMNERCTARKIPRGVIYLDEETANYFVADMLEFINFVVRFPAGSVYPTDIDRVRVSTTYGNIIKLDADEAIRYGFYEFVTRLSHKRTMTLTEHTELKNSYPHTIKFKSNKFISEKMIQLPGKETLTDIMGDNVGMPLVHLSYINAIAIAISEYFEKMKRPYETETKIRLYALSAVDILHTYLNYISVQNKFLRSSQNFARVVNKLTDLCPKFPNERFIRAYEVISDNREFILEAVKILT